MNDTVTLADVYAARATIAGAVRRTPLRHCASLSGRLGAEVSLKLETMHDTGAFKIRGATNFIRRLDAAQRARGVVTVSTGNHGRGVALAARRAGVRAVVCMSELVPAVKVEAIRALGAEVRIAGRDQDEAEREAERLAANGMVMVPPFDHPHIIAGQGTIGLELLEDMPRIDTLVCPLSGGGLLAGIALVVKAANPATRVVGVSMARGAGMVESLRAGRPVPVEEQPTLADSLGGGIGLDNRWTFPMVRDLVDDTVLLDEAQIADGLRHLYWQERLVAEGGGAVATAALLHGLVGKVRGNVVCVVSGGNIDMRRFSEIVASGTPA